MTFIRTELAEALMEALPILVADLHTGIISDATPQAEELFGYTVRGALVGVCVDALVPTDRRGLHAQHRDDYERSPFIILMGHAKIVEGQRKDGTVFPIKAILVPKVMGGVKSVITIIVDLSGLPVQPVTAH